MGRRPARLAALLENERNCVWLHIFKVEGQDGAAYQVGDNSEVHGAEGPLTCETLSGL